MLEIIIFIIVGFILYNIWSDPNWWLTDWVERTFFSVLTILVGGGAGIMFGTLLSIPLGMTEISRTDCRTPIYSLTNQSGIQGSFCLGSGYIASQEYYYCFTRDERGGYERWQIPSYNACIFMDVDGEPYASWQQVTSVPSKWALLWPELKHTADTKYDLHVPANTIIQKFEVK